MAYGYKFFNSNGSIVMSSEDPTCVLIDQFDVSAGNTGNKTYSYPVSRIFAMASRIQGGTVSPSHVFPSRSGWTFGLKIVVSGTNASSTVTWSNPEYRALSVGGGIGTYVEVPNCTSTIYVYLI